MRALDQLEGRDDGGRWEIERGNRLVRTERAKYTYDARGRRAVKLTLSADGAHAEEATEYTWDCRDRLREVKLLCCKDLDCRFKSQDIIQPSSVFSRLDPVTRLPMLEDFAAFWQFS